MTATLTNPKHFLGKRPRTIPRIVRPRYQTTLTDENIDSQELSEQNAEYTVTESDLIYPDTAAWLQVVLTQLRAIVSLPDGWDSYNAPSPDVNIIEAAWGLISCLCENTNLPKPHVNPTRNGGVQFEWECDDRYFEIEVTGERTATFFYCDDTVGLEETGRIVENEDLLEPVRAYINRVECIG